MPLLMFYGVGGIGKTTLLNHLQQQCEQTHIPYAFVNLAGASAVDQALPRLATYLIGEYSFKFDSFVRVLTVLSAKQAGSLFTPEIAKNTKGLRTGFDVTLEALGIIPLISPLASATKLSKTAAAHVFSKAMKAKGFRDAVMRMDGQGELLELEEEQLRKKLIERFAADLSGQPLNVRSSWLRLPSLSHIGVRRLLETLCGPPRFDWLRGA